MVMIRLNGVIGKIFKDWLEKHFPERASKVWNQIASLHNGNVNESRWRYRMRGEGHMAYSIHSLFKTCKKLHFNQPRKVELAL